MNKLKEKLQFEGTELEFIKSLMRLNIIVDLLSKELHANYFQLNSNYKKNLVGIAKSFEKFKLQVNSSSNWSYNHLSDGQKMALFTLSEEVEKIIKDVTNEIYED